MMSVPPESHYQLTNLDSKYSLVIAVAKRARQIVNRREPGVVLPHKPVTIALEEIGQGRVRVITRDDAVAEKAKGTKAEVAGSAEDQIEGGTQETPEMPKPEVGDPKD